MFLILETDRFSPCVDALQMGAIEVVAGQCRVVVVVVVVMGCGGGDRGCEG